MVLIVPILIFIIAVSGCTYKDAGAPGGEKTYTNNGISFNYPPEYEIKNVSDTSGVFVEGTSNIDPNCTFQISKEHLEGKLNALNLKDLKDIENLKKSNYTIEENETTKIDNVTGFDMIYARYSPPYVKYESIFFEKNGNLYNILFEYNGIGVTDTRAVESITNSFKII